MRCTRRKNGPDRGRGQIRQGGHVLARRDQDVALEYGPGVQERDDVGVVEHDVRRHPAGGDVAEHAVADGITFLLARLARTIASPGSLT